MVGTKQRLLILGTRGIPAAHGGFETFAQRLALHLADRGWSVGVYCQHEGADRPRPPWSDVWHGVERIHVEVGSSGPLGTMSFDWRCIRDAAHRPGLCLVLGYNTGLMLPWLRLANRRVMTNMDGIEWRRSKWSKPVKAWFWINEWIAAWSSHCLIADHPAIEDHLATRRPRDAIVTIPYGGDAILHAPEGPVRALGLEPNRYLISVARIEPENNILQLVEAFSRAPRGLRLAVLGTLDPSNAYHRAVKAAAADEVLFPGAIYEPARVGALRYHARVYLHGHSVGGTNPSLVEALWAGNAVIAHDNAFNRWTAGEAALYFGDTDACAASIETFATRDDVLASARLAARRRAALSFDWRDVLGTYERHITSVVETAAPGPRRRRLPNPDPVAVPTMPAR